MPMHLRSFFCEANLLNRLTLQVQARSYARCREPFATKVCHYLNRAKLIDSIRLTLRSNTPNSSLPSLINHRLLDSFVVTHALRSAPSADSALSLVHALQDNSRFSHTQNTLHALATVLAKSGRRSELKSLLHDIRANRFGTVRISFMNLMQWHAAAGDLDTVLQAWEKYTLENNHLCAESYNIVLALYAQKGKDSEAVTVFHRMIEEGSLPNCRTYTVIIEHLVKCRRLSEAMEVFNLLPLMRIKRTLKQYSVLVEGFVASKRFDEAMVLVEEMQVDGILPNMQTFSGLMHYFSQLGDIKTVQKLFSMVRQSGLEPDAYLYKVLIQGYCKSKRAALAWRLFEDMKNSGVMPDSATKDLLVKSLWQEGRRREAAAVEESCEEINTVLPHALQGHVWTVSSADLTRVYDIYSNSFA
uniref:Pentatricopeptide repeat-containing protein At5g66631 family n=1 Tax=Cajanus cajan TaxID=3821 RepID=A0A151TI41_CAJCA|nr:Pentatricopeptide repeat-containing protein At5g66631 family [Cajanus cajan]